MNIPSTYAEWVPLLKKFAESADSDAEILPIMESGTISWSDGLAQKFAGRCGDCLMARLELLQKKFNLELQHSHGSLDGIVATTISVRKRLKPMARFANIEGFPEELKAYLQENLKNIVDGMQKGLEDELEEKAKHSTTQANILVAVRRNPIQLPGDEEINEKPYSQESTTTAEETLPSFNKKKKRLLF